MKKLKILTTGFAIFAMLFGAGNVVYPLITGQFAQDKYILATIGFLISSAFFAFIGILAMVLFEGDYLKFFSRLGKFPGFILTVIIMCLIGPLGAIPRIVTVSYGSLHSFIPNVNFTIFSAVACILIYFLTLKRNRMLDVIGYVLTPMLLISLILLIISGFCKIPFLSHSPHTHYKVLLRGFSDGNQTMDLLGALCFSSIIFKFLKTKNKCHKKQNKKIFISTLKAGCIGIFLLSLIYIGFVRLAAYHSPSLANIKNIEILKTLSENILGAKASIISSIAISLACLTTAIALSAVFTDFLYDKIFKKNVKYPICLAISVVISFIFSTLNFDGIMKLLAPILQVCYPALIVLSILNISHKFLGTKVVKTPVFVTIAISFAWQFIPWQSMPLIGTS